MSDFQHDVAGISALDDDHRRELYLFVSAQPEPVSREQAAKALGVPVHLATFHPSGWRTRAAVSSTYGSPAGQDLGGEARRRTGVGRPRSPSPCPLASTRSRAS